MGTLKASATCVCPGQLIVLVKQSNSILCKLQRNFQVNKQCQEQKIKN